MSSTPSLAKRRRKTLAPAPVAADLPDPTGQVGKPERIAPRSLAEDVYDTLKNDIAAFRLIPGDRFTENEICERLELSRTPVRQALFRLQQEGYVEVLFRSGWRVLPFDFDLFDQLYGLRRVLETDAVRRLSRNPSEAGKHAIAQLCELWIREPEQRVYDSPVIALQDEQFHCILVASAGNPEIARVHKEVTDRIRIVRQLDFTQHERIDATYDEHTKILQAIRNHRADAAADLIDAHIELSQIEVRKITLHQIYEARHRTQNGN